jgi:hypothetical protein
MRKAEGDRKARSKKPGRRALRLLLLLGAGILGWYLGFRLPEEKRNRTRKLMTEAREMPFRIFV